MRVLTLWRMGSTLCGVALLAMSGSVIAAGNWIVNPGFDTSLAGWANPFSRAVSWNAADSRGVPDSGSARITNQGTSNGGTPLTIVQCVPLTPSAAYTFGARLKIPGGQPTETTAMVFVDTYTSSDCNSGFLRGEIVSGSGATWEQKSGSLTAGATAHSALLALGVLKPTGVTADASALFDTVFLRRSGEPFEVGPAMSANWYDPAQSGHGIFLEQLSSTGAWMCWFAFDLAGNRTWICGLGNASGNTIQFPDAFVVNGGKFPPLFDPAAVSSVRWGSITLAFTGCDTGTMSWTTSLPGFQSGSMPIARLTTLWANGCSP